MPITWALIGPGTLGSASGRATSYTPPTTIGAETVVTVKASAGPGLSDAVEITVVPSTAIDVTGRVVGMLGPGLPGLTVGIGGKTAVTGADGRFSIPGVVPPYDLSVVLSRTQLFVGRYEGLTRPDPTLVFLWLFDSGEPNTASVSGTVSGGDAVGTAGEFTAAIFTTSEVRFEFEAVGITGRNNPFTLPISWFGPESIRGDVHVLQWKSPSPGAPPTAYIGYGVHSGVTLARGASVEGADVTLTSPGTATISGSILPPDGYTVQSKILELELAGLTAVPLGHLDTSVANFVFAVPAQLPRSTSAAVTASAQLLGAGTTSRRISGIPPASTDRDIDLPAPALPTSPADGSTNVTGETTFAWTPLEHAVHFVVFNGGSDSPSIYVVTAGTSIASPGLAVGARYSWFVAGFAPFDSVNAFTGGADLFPRLGSFVRTVSEPRSFVTR